MRHLLSFATLLAACAGVSATAQEPPSAVTVQLSNFKFTPETLMLKHGHPYVIHFVNSASGGHDFIAADFFAAASIAPEDRGKIRHGGVSLGGGESADVHLVVGSPGTYKSHCSHFMHSSFGMSGKVIVE